MKYSNQYQPLAIVNTSLLMHYYPENGGYYFHFNGKERDDETYGSGNEYDFGDRIYSPRLGRWLSVDPLQRKYAGLTPYNFVGNMPIVAIDPDGRDIIILSDKGAAKGAGHQALLIGNAKDGWTYISKDGAADGGATGKSRFTVAHYKSVAEFRNSPHNFDLVDGENHSNVGGGENKNVTFKLDENGNKVQRYEEAYYVRTTQTDGSSTDKKSVMAAEAEASADYCLTKSDCSDVVTAGLKAGENSEGKPLKPAQGGGLVGEIPRVKQAKIESKNRGVDFDNGIKADDTKLKTGEKGEKQ